MRRTSPKIGTEARSSPPLSSSAKQIGDYGHEVGDGDLGDGSPDSSRAVSVASIAENNRTTSVLAACVVNDTASDDAESMLSWR